jgi:large subunit ribosomal protein L6
MSRIGKLPISLPAKVVVTVAANNVVTVKGPKGQLSEKVDSEIAVHVESDVISVTRPTDQKRHRAMHGLYRSLISNMVLGVSEGYTQTLELFGVGYRVESTGNLITFTIGYSHPVMFSVPKEVEVVTKMEKGSPPTVILTSNDKQLLGQVCAKIRGFKKQDPYKGKGILFKGEVIRRKAGKTAGAKK